MNPYDIVDEHYGTKPTTTTERVAVITYAIITRKAMTTNEVAAAAAISRQAAWAMMMRMVRVLPIGFDDDKWVWIGKNGA